MNSDPDKIKRDHRILHISPWLSGFFLSREGLPTKSHFCIFSYKWCHVHGIMGIHFEAENSLCYFLVFWIIELVGISIYFNKLFVNHNDFCYITLTQCGTLKFQLAKFLYNASQPYIRTGPPPIITAIPMVSRISSEVAFDFRASWTWKAMQPSHRTVMAIPKEISSLVLEVRTPSAVLAICSV